MMYVQFVEHCFKDGAVLAQPHTCVQCTPRQSVIPVHADHFQDFPNCDFATICLHGNVAVKRNVKLLTQAVSSPYPVQEQYQTVPICLSSNLLSRSGLNGTRVINPDMSVNCWQEVRRLRDCSAATVKVAIHNSFGKSLVNIILVRVKYRAPAASCRSQPLNFLVIGYLLQHACDRRGYSCCVYELEKVIVFSLRL